MTGLRRQWVRTDAGWHLRLDGYDVHHPRPLRIDGHAYRRRTLSRRGRRR